jgi:hypothetical protein
LSCSIASFLDNNALNIEASSRASFHGGNSRTITNNKIGNDQYHTRCQQTLPAKNRWLIGHQASRGLRDFLSANNNILRPVYSQIKRWRTLEQTAGISELLIIPNEITSPGACTIRNRLKPALSKVLPFQFLIAR